MYISCIKPDIYMYLYISANNFEIQKNQSMAHIAACATESGAYLCDAYFNMLHRIWSLSVVHKEICAT
jgi:hypothetical protein